MWPKKYRDYPEDEALVRQQVEPGRGIVGCEMHDVNGWQQTLHRAKKRKNLLTKLLSYLFNTERESL